MTNELHASDAVYGYWNGIWLASLQGTLMMLVAGVNALSARGGDVVGAAIYAGYPGKGFLYCALLTTVMYAGILPVLLLIPKTPLDTADGQPAESATGVSGLESDPARNQTVLVRAALEPVAEIGMRDADERGGTFRY